jgi:hypothetical protein
MANVQNIVSLPTRKPAHSFTAPMRRKYRAQRAVAGGIFGISAGVVALSLGHLTQGVIDHTGSDLRQAGLYGRGDRPSHARAQGGRYGRRDRSGAPKDRAMDDRDRDRNVAHERVHERVRVRTARGRDAAILRRHCSRVRDPCAPICVAGRWVLYVVDGRSGGVAGLTAKAGRRSVYAHLRTMSGAEAPLFFMARARGLVF